MPRKRTDDIHRAITAAVFWSSASPVRRVARQFGLTPQAIQLHIKELLRSGDLIATGERRHRRYQLAVRSQSVREYPLDGSINEDLVWQQFVRPQVTDLSPTEQELCHYGLTEIVNNAIDHAGAQTMQVTLTRTSASITLTVTDNGVGLFQKIATALGLTDPRQSLLELSKGKFTTDPQHHTGEGIFFTSRSFDRFTIRSSDLLFSHSSRSDDWMFEIEEKTFLGTRLAMGLILPAVRELKQVFERFSSGPDEYRFAKTHVPLKLATYGDEGLLSRSSAKRVLSRVDRFSEVLLDFANVRSIGQAFADEIFRIYAQANPSVQLIAINANEQVTQMIRRAQSNR
jgi:anti-sigma regulatory factor (Ser/Thr protein kinase)